MFICLNFITKFITHDASNYLYSGILTRSFCTSFVLYIYFFLLIRKDTNEIFAEPVDTKEVWNWLLVHNGKS